MAPSARLPGVPATVTTLIGVVAALYFAEEVFMPLALAGLLAFVLSPVARGLERLHLGRSVAALAAALAAGALLASVAYVVGNQFLGVVQELPQYKTNLLAKIRPLRAALGIRLGETARTVKELGAEINRKPASPQVPRVEVVQPPPSPTQVARDLVAPLAAPLAMAGMTVVFLIFLLLERDALRERLIRLIGGRDIRRTTAALDEATSRIVRYLASQTLINGLQGTLIAAGLALIGVPNALLWGALAMVLRFIPYLGVWIAASMPVALSLAVFKGWTQPLATVGLFLVVEGIANNWLEPRLYGHRTGVSPLALLVAAAFWTWLWGPLGLLLAIPLTVSLVVLGKHLPPLHFFSVLLGDGPVLDPQERFYERLLAREPDEAEELVEEALAAGSPVEVLDAIVLPALALAERDYQRGELDEARRRDLLEWIEEAAQPLGGHEAPAAGGRPPAVLCLPAGGEADALAAELLARLLAGAGIAAQAQPGSVLRGEMLEAIERLRPGCVCIAALPPGAGSRAAGTCRRVRARFPELPVIVGLWAPQGEAARAEARLLACGASVAASAAAALEAIGRLAQPQPAPTARQACRTT